MTGRDAQALRSALLVADTMAAAVAVVGAYLIRFEVLATWIPVEGRTDVLPGRYAQALPAAVLLLLLATAAAGLYRRDISSGPLRTPEILRVIVFGAAALSTVALLYWREFQYSRGTLVLAAGFHGLLIIALRPVARRAAAHVQRQARGATLLVGGGDPARRVCEALDGGVDGRRAISILPMGDPIGGDLAVLPDLESALDGLQRGRWREVFVALPAAESARLPDLLRRLEESTADVHVVPDIGSARLVNASADVVRGVPVVSLRQRPLHGAGAAAKRTADLIVAIGLLFALAPVLLAIGAAVRLTSPGPALFGQMRMGIDGREFRMWKFRTMVERAEAETGPVFARPGDPRVTRIGRFLRRFSLDELPQLWNVVRGEMSLVGPRPERAPFIEEFRRRLPGYMLRHTVKAGMTGWAQVHGLRGESSIEERLRYDLEYVDRWSLSFDVEILGRTAVQVIVGRNAC